MRDWVWDSATTYLSDRTAMSENVSCYVKIHAPNFLYWWLMPCTQESKEGGDYPTSPLVAKRSNAWGADPLTPEAGVRAAAGEVHATVSLQCIWHLHFSSETQPQGGYFLVQMRQANRDVLLDGLGSHFLEWIDYNGVTFSQKLLEWVFNFRDFGLRKFL